MSKRKYKFISDYNAGKEIIKYGQEPGRYIRIGKDRFIKKNTILEETREGSNRFRYEKDGLNKVFSLDFFERLVKKGLAIKITNDTGI